MKTITFHESDFPIVKTDVELLDLTQLRDAASHAADVLADYDIRPLPGHDATWEYNEQSARYLKMLMEDVVTVHCEDEDLPTPSRTFAALKYVDRYCQTGDPDIDNDFHLNDVISFLEALPL